MQSEGVEMGQGSRQNDLVVQDFCGPSLCQLYGEKLIQGLSSQFNTQSFCDVALSIGSTRILVHSCVLSIFSPYFAHIMNMEACNYLRKPIEEESAKTEGDPKPFWSSKSPLLLNLDNLKDSFVAMQKCSNFEDLVLGMVKFLYSGEISLTDENVEDFQTLSEIFNSDLLLTEIAQYKEKTAWMSMEEFNAPGDFDVKEEVEIKSSIIPSDGSKNQLSILQSSKKRNLKLVEDKKSGNCCARCGLMFSNPRELKEHRKAHFTKSFVCVTCGDAYYHIMEMMKHLDEWKHGETKCSVCGHDSESQSALIIHLDKHREPGKPYYCKECDQRFKSKRDLTMHIPKHSSQATFVCQVCSKGFKWKHALVAHMVTHSAEQKFLCSDCGFSTKHQTSFAAHQRQHTGKTYTCPVQDCGFKTIRKQNLKQHSKTHTKEKPHQCEICGQAFSLAKNMKRHAQLHDITANPEVCPAFQSKGCSFKSFRKDKMLIHINKHHPWLIEGVEQTDGVRQRQLADVAFGNPMSMANPPNTMVTQSLATVPIHTPMVVIAGDIIGESGGLVQQAMTTATVMTLSDSSPTGTLHYHNTKPEIDLEAEILKY